LQYKSAEKSGGVLVSSKEFDARQVSLLTTADLAGDRQTVPPTYNCLTTDQARTN